MRNNIEYGIRCFRILSWHSYNGLVVAPTCSSESRSAGRFVTASWRVWCCRTSITSNLLGGLRARAEGKKRVELLDIGFGHGSCTPVLDQAQGVRSCATTFWGRFPQSKAADWFLGRPSGSSTPHCRVSS